MMTTSFGTLRSLSSDYYFRQEKALNGIASLHLNDVPKPFLQKFPGEGVQHQPLNSEK